MTYLFAPPATPSLEVVGNVDRFPVHRIYCVGRNFAEHAREMGSEVDRGTPIFFGKPADAVVAGGGQIAYPPGTIDLHHEVEMVVALGSDAPPGRLQADVAERLVFGYTVGVDLTRRDLQARAKSKGLPWDTAKGFDQSAPLGAVMPKAQFGELANKRLWISVNGELRQQALLGEMVWGVNAILIELSALYSLRAGDLIFMGTPAGVAALVPGDRFRAGIDDLITLDAEIVSNR
ncbi:MAG: fumarylacetoacetate hydrolase family protein [Pseudomarimonas sp.]